MASVSISNDLLHQITPIVEHEVGTELLHLAAAYQASRLPKVNRKTLIKAEYDAAYREWYAKGLPQKINWKYTMLALNQSADAAAAYLKTQFEEANPKYKNLEFPPGRPEGYMGPKKRMDHAQGIVIAMLLERCGKELLRELTSGK